MTSEDLGNIITGVVMVFIVCFMSFEWYLYFS